MAVDIALFSDPQFSTPIQALELGEAELPWNHDFTEGQPHRIFGANQGTSTVRDFAVGLDGPGAATVRLAQDDDGSHGVWAAPGEPVIVKSYLGPREDFTFWAQALFTHEDRDGEHPFQIVFRGVSIG